MTTTAANLDAAWRERVARTPGDLALRYRDIAWTAAELDARAETLAAALEAAGVGPGDRAGLLLQNVPEAIVVLLAAWRRGAAVALLNPMYHRDELRHALTDSGARLVVADGELLETLTEAAHGTSVETVWSVGDADGGTAATDTLDAVLRQYDGRRATPVDLGHDTVALLTYTSGTTGPPKGAMNTHGNVLAVADGVRDRMGLVTDDRVLCVAPIFHITGAVITTAAPLLAGAAVVLIGRPTPEGVADAFDRHGVTTTTGSITVYHGLARLPGLDPSTFAGVRHLWSGGAPVPPATVERFRDTHGVYIHNIYGMTETTSACIGVPVGERAPVDPATGSLAIGKPYPGVEVRVVDTDGVPLAAGEQGELEIAGPCVIPGYWRNEEATARTLPGGRLRTGDGAVIDDEGWVYIVDRLKDQINTSGYKVWPREVEDALTHHPDVLEAAVVGEPDDYRGEAVSAHVSLRPDASVTTDDLVAFARERLAAYKVPRRIVVVDELPKTPTGKVRRRALRED